MKNKRVMIRSRGVAFFQRMTSGVKSPFRHRYNAKASKGNDNIKNKRVFVIV